jgi:uncharacterized protein (TIGR00156 family)
MKKIAAMTAIVALVSMPVLAAEQGGFTGPARRKPARRHAKGGFIGPSGSVTTVANAKSLRDDTWVTLRGKIVSAFPTICINSRMLPGR